MSIKSTWVRGRATKVRAFIRDSVNDAHEPPEGGKTLADPVYIEVVGQLSCVRSRRGTKPVGVLPSFPNRVDKSICACSMQFVR